MSTNKEILLVTNYFPPERGAAPNRMYAMAEGFQKRGYSVTVVCPMPNYPEGEIFKAFRGKLSAKEETKIATIHRLWIWPSKSQNKLVRLLSMSSFAFSLKLFFLFKKTPKTVFIQYSPIFVGTTAIMWTWILGKKRMLNVSDLWPLAGLEMGIFTKGLYYSILERMEKFCYRKSNLVVGQSEEILTHVKKVSTSTHTLLYRNVPNFPLPKLREETKVNNTVSIVYAGLLGMAQGMASILQGLKLPDHCELHVYGGGPEAEAIRALEHPQIHYYGEVTRDELHAKLADYDVAFIPLVNRIYGSVPSKIFEYTRLGLPVLYYAGGEGGALVDQHQLGWTIPVGNEAALQQWMDKVSREKLLTFPKKKIQGRTAAAFNFEDQFNTLVAHIEKL